jgi:hypothetical protein
MKLVLLTLALALVGVAPVAANPTETAKPAPDIQVKKRVVILETSEISGGGNTAPTKTGEVDVGTLTVCEEGAQSLNIVANEERDGQKRRIKLQSCIKGNDPAERLAALRGFRERMAKDGNLSEGLKQSVLAQLDAEIARLSKAG